MFEVPFPHPIRWGVFHSKKAELLAQIAVMFCGWIHDRPVTSYVSKGQIFGEAEYQCYLIWYNCGGAVLSRQYYGMGFGSGLLPLIEEKYEYYKSEIEANVPALLTFIDLRTTEQLLNDCCPPMLYD